MKILFVFTGGTIGSTVSGSYISTDSKKPYVLLDEYNKKYGLDFEYDTISPYTELSENNTGATIGALVKCILPYQNSDYDGIIITHGTDTIQYSSSALAYTLKPRMPIMILSSNYPIEDTRANGLVNLQAAVAFIKQVKTPGVWVAYQNSGEAAVIHYGTRLLASSAFSDRMSSIKDAYYGSFDDEFVFHVKPDQKAVPDEIDPLPCGDLEKAAERILRIEPYPGMVYPKLTNIDHIIHGSYHSGTINTKYFFPKDFFAKVRESGINVFITGVSADNWYESAKLFDELSLIPLINIAPVSAYVKLWLCVSGGIDPKQVLSKPLASDLCM